MDKKEEFKRFIKDKEFLIDKVNKGETSWQKLYEIYDIYGEDESVWKKYTTKSVVDGINVKSLLNTIKNINLDSLEENISSIQKAVMLIEELTRKEGTNISEGIKEEKINNDSNIRL